jgi:hypothetical protein
MSQAQSFEASAVPGSAGGKKPKRLTQEEIEEEEERKRLEELRLIAEAAEDARYKHVTPLQLNQTTHDPMPSLSPRDHLSYQADKKPLKEMQKFRENNPVLNKFVLLLQTEIMKAKPDNIVKWVDRYFFEANNIKKIRKELSLEDPDEVKPLPVSVKKR